MLALQAKNKGVTLTTRVARDTGDLVADRRAVQQVLINLVGNALKFTDAGGVVSLDCERKGADIVFTVSDTGIGIPEDKIALLGRPFMQVQNDYARKYEGTGLGLSLVKGLVELHGGRVSITSGWARGPWSPYRSRKPAPKPSPSRRPPRRSSPLRREQNFRRAFGCSEKHE